MGKTKKNKKEESNMEVKLILSITAIALSIFSLFYTIYTDNKNYSREENPKIQIINKLSAKREILGDTIFDIDHILKIEDVNNLENLYFILPNNKMIEIDDFDEEINLEESLRNLSIEDKDIVKKIGKYYYKYYFLISKSIYEDIDIYLAFSKSESIDKENEIAKVEFDFFREDEVFMFEKYELNNPDYEGERIIAEQYKEIVKWYKENTLN